MTTCQECYALINSECAALHDAWHRALDRDISEATANGRLALE